MYFEIFALVNREIIEIMDVQTRECSVEVVSNLLSLPCPQLRRLSVHVETNALGALDTMVLERIVNAGKLSRLFVSSSGAKPSANALFGREGFVAHTLKTHASTLKRVHVCWMGEMQLEYLREFGKVHNVSSFANFYACIAAIRQWVSPNKMCLDYKGHTLSQIWFRRFAAYADLPPLEQVQELLSDVTTLKRLAGILYNLLGVARKGGPTARNWSDPYLSWVLEKLDLILRDERVKHKRKIDIISRISGLVPFATMKTLIELPQPPVSLDDLLRNTDTSEHCARKLLGDLEWSTKLENFNPHRKRLQSSFMTIFGIFRRPSSLRQVLSHPSVDISKSNLLSKLLKHIHYFKISNKKKLQKLYELVLAKLPETHTSLFEALLEAPDIADNFSDSVCSSVGKYFAHRLDLISSSSREVVHSPAAVGLTRRVLEWVSTHLDAEQARAGKESIVLDLWVAAISLTTTDPRSWNSCRSPPPNDRRIFPVILKEFPDLPPKFAEFVDGKIDFAALELSQKRNAVPVLHPVGPPSPPNPVVFGPAPPPVPAPTSIVQTEETPRLRRSLLGDRGREPNSDYDSIRKVLQQVVAAKDLSPAQQPFFL